MKIYFTKQAYKQYQALPIKFQQRIKKKLRNLKENIYLGKKLKGELKDYHSLRAWPHRVIYQIFNKKNEVWILAVLHRQGVYK